MIRDLRTLGPIAGLFLSSHRSMLLGGALLSAATVICGIALLGLSGWFITATAIAGFSAATALAFDIFAPSAGIRFLALSRAAARYGERITTHNAALGVLAALRERLFRGWATPDAARAMMLSPARILFRLTIDLDALDSLYLRILVPAFAAFCAAAVTAVALGFMDPWLGLTTGATLLFAGFGIPIFAAVSAALPAHRRAHALEVLRSRTIDLVQGQTELAMAGRLSAQRRAIAAADRRLADADDVLNRIESATSAAFGVISAALLAGTLVAAAFLAQDGTIGAPVAALGLLIVLSAVEPFAALRRGAVELGRTVLAAGRIGSRLEHKQTDAAARTPSDGFALSLDRVAAGYPGNAVVLHDISLAIRDGERVALIGKSGAGKSTLLALIASELVPITGSIEMRPATLLTQRTQLFRDSVRDNLTLANPTATDTSLRDALEAAGLRDDIDALPDGIHTKLGEGGMGLSGGQSRRLALARLFLRDTPLWLLDEPTESLDGATARDVIRRLIERSQGRTLLIATHIRREAEIADRLLIVEHGRITATVRRGEPNFDQALASLRPD
jgi:ATP-binding cassette subfamily C protein CydC